MNQESQKKLIMSVGSAKHELAVARLLRDNDPQHLSKWSARNIPPERKLRVVLELPSRELAASLLMFYAKGSELSAMLGDLSIPAVAQDQLALVTTQGCCLGHQVAYLELLRYHALWSATHDQVGLRNFDLVLSVENEIHLPDQDKLKHMGYEICTNPQSLVTMALPRARFDTVRLKTEGKLLSRQLPDYRFEGEISYRNP